MMKKLMLSCRAASELIERKHHAKLSFWERLQLAYHKTMCDACSLYDKQSGFLERLFNSDTDPSEDLKLDHKKLENKILSDLNARDKDS
ncbi:MAG: hypothetical protein IPL46_04690 [Saprospiraceae bacterium]|nr:hypothetical protein [Saprospiraceae bacterium]